MSDTATRTGSWTTPMRWTLAAAILGSAVAFIDATVVNVALSALQRDFGADVAGVQWVVNAYTLMLAALTLTGGALGDLYGRKKMFGLGLLIFAAASLACGLSPSLPLLIAFRLAQGLGGALLVPGSLAMIDAVFPDASRGRAVGLWSSVTSVVTVFGPVLGGFLVDSLSWRWVFFINLPLSLGVLWCLRGVPETRAGGEGAKGEGRPDLVGALLVTLGLGALTYGLISAGASGFGGTDLLFVLGGLALLGAFVGWEARAGRPMLPLSLFRSGAFAGTNLLTLLLYAALGGTLFFLPLNLIGVLGYSATAAGSALLPLSLLLAALSSPFGSLSGKWGPRLFLTAGPVVAGAGFALLGLLNIGGSYWTGLFPAAVVIGLGMALTVAPLVSAVLGSVGRDRSGTASGVNNAVSRAAGLLAIALGGLLMLGSFRPALETRLGAADLPAPARAQMVDQSARLAQTPIPGSLSQRERQDAKAAVNVAFQVGFRRVCLAAALLAVLAGAAGFFSVTGAGVREAQPSD